MAEEPIVHSITRRIGKMLGHWGVDADQYHWLLQASFKMDFRSQGAWVGASEASATTSALRWTVILNLLFSAIISLVFVVSKGGTLIFSVILLGYAMVMVGMSIVTEFGLVVISPDDFVMLAHRPISSRTFFAVKFSNLTFYILIVCLSLGVVPALAGLACAGSRWYFPLVYLAATVLSAFFVAGAVVALYGLLLRRVNYEKFKDLLVYCQVAFSFLFFFGYQVVPRFAGRIEAADIVSLAHSWAVVFPSVWFGSLVELALGHTSWEAAVLGLLAVLVLAVILPFLIKSVSLDYSQQISRMISSSSQETGTASAGPRSRFLIRWLNRFFLANVEERAFFHFIVAMLRRNRRLKLQLYANFGVVAAMLGVALLQKDMLIDPFTQPTSGFATFIPVMTFLFAATGLATQLPYSDECAGSWIFQVAPIAERARILKAIKKAAILALFLPLFVLTSLLFSFVWPVTHALEQGLYGLAVGLLCFQIMLFMFRDFPFSRMAEKGFQNMRLMMLFVMMPIYGVAVGLPYLFASGQRWFLLALGLVLSVALLLGRLNNRCYARQKIREDF